jgi:uncharacterized membrane protein
MTTSPRVSAGHDVSPDDITVAAEHDGVDPIAAAHNMRAGTHGHALEIEAATREVLDHPSGARLRGIAERLEDARGLDRVAAPLRTAMAALLDRPPLGDALAGRWLGHALHPLLTDFPLGMWIGTSVLDFFGGESSQDAADRLLLGGIVATLPTMASGWRDWTSLERRPQRVGLVHAASNSSALLLNTASYLSRRRGHRGRGVVLSVGAGVLANIGGYLGVHLTLVRGVTTPAARDD